MQKVHSPLADQHLFELDQRELLYLKDNSEASIYKKKKDV